MNDQKYDSYSDGAYRTLNPSTIINSFDGMNTEGQAGSDLTVLQCQVSLFPSLSHVSDIKV
jgi:hypothetical protein